MQLTQQLVKELLDYDPGSGVFTWRERDISRFGALRDWRRWNRRYAGKRAGTLHGKSDGYRYRQIRLFGDSFSEHRLAWAWMLGDTSVSQVDHINRDGTDNRWVNLRAATPATNMKNRSMSRNNASGVTGVHWDAVIGKWRAHGRSDRQAWHLGCFRDLDVAAMEVLEFRAEHGFSRLHGLEIASYHREAA